MINTFLLGASNYTLWIVLGIAVVMMIVLSIFNRSGEKKRRAAEEERIKSLRVGQKVMMSCGIYGTIVAVEEISPVDTNIVIETGVEGSKSTMTFDVRALYRVIPEQTTEQATENAAEETAATENKEQDQPVFNENEKNDNE